jgi:glucosamine-6-phosphate deaminase
VPVEIRTFATADDVAHAAAARIADALRRTPALVLGLASGRTPLATYAELARLHATERLDFSRATTFNLDEFIGVASDHPGSFRRFMHEHFFAAVNLDAAGIGFLDGTAPDPVVECERYERAIAERGGLDLQILGIGANGHIGFNEPGDALESRTHVVRLHDTTRRDNAGLFGGDPGAVPGEALSMGMGTILKAKAIILLATGERKAACVERMVNGPVTTRLPASFLQLHARADLYLDAAAASRLTHRTQGPAAAGP